MTRGGLRSEVKRKHNSLYTSPVGTFLSKRAIGGQTKKVPVLAINGKVGKRPCYKEKHVEMVLSANRRKVRRT